MGAPKLKKSVYKKSDKTIIKRIITKDPHLKLVKTLENPLEERLATRAAKNLHKKSEIKHYQDIISKSLDDPEMVKKAAMLLLDMLEK